MTSPVTRAALIAAIGTLSLVAPFIEWWTAILFAVMAIGAVAIPRESRLFDILAHPIDYEAGKLRGLAGFTLAGTALAILGTVEAFHLPVAVFVVTMLLVGWGNLGETLARQTTNTQSIGAVTFVIAGSMSAIAGWAFLESVGIVTDLSLGIVVFFASLGSLVGALCRTDFYRRDDPVVLLTVGVILWILTFVVGETHIELVLVALAITAALGGLAYILETASVAGMLSGTIVGYVTVVLAGFAWFALLLTFFAIGGMATKFRYEEKLARGVAERRRGARGTGNVLGNSLIAVIAVVAYAIAPTMAWLSEAIVAIAFCGAVATALADTLSSEIGTLQDDPRLITTFERVHAGTDGAVTVLGTAAGAVGAGIVAAIAFLLLPEIEGIGAGIVIVAGLAGMMADSIFGATIEDSVVGNQGVNLLATVVGAVMAGLTLWITQVALP